MKTLSLLMAAVAVISFAAPASACTGELLQLSSAQTSATRGLLHLAATPRITTGVTAVILEVAPVGMRYRCMHSTIEVPGLNVSLLGPGMLPDDLVSQITAEAREEAAMFNSGEVKVGFRLLFLPADAGAQRIADATAQRGQFASLKYDALMIRD